MKMRKELKDKRNRDLRFVYNVSLFMAAGMFGIAFVMLVIMTPEAMKWTLMSVEIIIGTVNGMLADKMEEKAVMRCRSWRKNSDSVKNRAA